MAQDGRLWILPWQLISQNTTVDIEEQLEAQARKMSYEQLRDEIDFAFISLHGKYGDDGCIQGVLELVGIPYTGSGVLASALGMDKDMQQKILRASGIDVPKSVLVTEKEWAGNKEDVMKRLVAVFGLPLVTKPPREGSSIGVTIIHSAQELEKGMDAALEWDNAVLIEEHLDGIEFSCIVMEENGEPRPLALTEIVPQSEYFTYDDKYMPGRCRKFTPPRNIPPDVTDHVTEEVIRAYTALGFRSYGRIDGFYLKDGRVLITDPNSSSGMAPSSFFFEQAAEAGMLPSMIISRLIEVSLAVHKEKKGPLQ
jgi:D-alanine-D-alanine ligase